MGEFILILTLVWMALMFGASFIEDKADEKTEHRKPEPEVKPIVDYRYTGKGWF